MSDHYCCKDCGQRYDVCQCSADSIGYEQALERAFEIDDKLTAADFKWQHRVYIEHEDGTILDFNYALLRQENDWFYIFTEHHGSFVFHKDDVAYYKAYVVED